MKHKVITGSSIRENFTVVVAQCVEYNLRYILGNLNLIQRTKLVPTFPART